jgi:ABC-type amino acid transport substrate-binding protein
MSGHASPGVQRSGAGEHAAAVLTRRQFLGASALGAALLGLGLVGCATSTDAASTTVSSTTTETSTLRIGSEVAYAPYEWQTSTESDTTVPIDGGGYADGFDVAWMKLIGERLGRDVLVVNMSFGGLIDALNQGVVDMVISGMGNTPERQESVAFSDTYHKGTYGLMLKADSAYASGTTLADFSGASVLGQKDTQLDAVIDQIPGVNHLTPVEHVPDQLSRLEAGACDAIVVNVENADGYLAKYPDLKLVTFPDGEGLIPNFDGACVALRKDDTDTLAKVNEVIDGVSQDVRDQMWSDASARQPA